jgi:hypothetical protein
MSMCFRFVKRGWSSNFRQTIQLVFPINHLLISNRFPTTGSMSATLVRFRAKKVSYVVVVNVLQVTVNMQETTFTSTIMNKWVINQLSLTQQ